MCWFARAVSALRRSQFLTLIRSASVYFDPDVTVTDCRDKKDNKYLELALVSEVNLIVSGDRISLC